MPKVTGSLSSTNEYSVFTGDNTNITLLNAQMNLSKNMDLSLGVGNWWTIEDGKNKNVPALEAKLNYNIGEFLSAGTRYRKLGGNDEYRLTFGSNYNFNKHHSISAETQFTLEKNNNWSKSTGLSLGYTYTFNNGIELTGEIEQGIPLDKDSPSIGYTLGSFKDSEKTFNVSLKIPIF
jgi:hypothetical protein